MPNGVLITGTTSGLGRALLAHYAGSGARVIAVNRRREPDLEAYYPAVRFECVDVRSALEVEKLVVSLADAGELPDLFLLNAGINRVDNDEFFRLADYQAVVDTNLSGVLNFIQPLTQLPAGEVARHVIAIGSMASYVGNPYGLGYHTSKLALRACFDAWSAMYAGTDLVFQQVLLGPIRTNMYTMADHFPAWMVRIKDAFSASLDDTVRAVSRFALSRRKKLLAPRRAAFLYLGMWLCQQLIPSFFRGRKTRAGKARRAQAGNP